MPLTRSSRWLLWIAGTLAALMIAAVGGLHFATQALKSKVEEALGPHGEIGEIKVGLSAIEVIGLRIKGEPSWPAAEELSAKRVVIEPDLRALLDKNIRIAAIHVEDGYLSLLRKKDGKIVLLPSLLSAVAAGKQGNKEDPGTEMPKIQVGSVKLTNAAVDFYDASVRPTPIKLRLEQANVRVGIVLLPDLTGDTSINIDAVVKGVRRDGKLNVDGHMEVATKNSVLDAHLRDVDMVTFQPYLIKAAETGVKKGTLNLDLKSTVKTNRLHAPGTVTLHDLELSSGSTFMGMPRDAVLSMLKDKSGTISVNFVLEGNINDPKFSLNENLAGRIGGSVASVLGISLEGLAKGVGGAGGSAAKGVSEAIGKLFGK